MTTYFTADLHVGHARLLELSNETVRTEDTVWVLGDYDMHGKAASLALVARLHGTKILVSGNHDACWAGMRDGWKKRDLYLEAGFAAVLDFAVTTTAPLRPQGPATRVLLSRRGVRSGRPGHKQASAALRAASPWRG